MPDDLSASVVPGMSWWAVATALLTSCPRAVALTDLDDTEFEEFGVLLDRTTRALKSVPAVRDLTDADVAMLVEHGALATMHGVGWLAVMWAVHDTRRSELTAAWSDTAEAFEPKSGDLVPLSPSHPCAVLFDGQGIRATADPSRSNPHGADELPFIRRVRAGPGGLLPRFDTSVRLRLAHLESLSMTAAAVLNESSADFNIPEPVTFPIEPIDASTQVNRAIQCVEQALTARADLIVLPELAVPDAAVDAVARLLEDQVAVVLAGSLHRIVDGRRCNVATLVLAGGVRVDFEKRVEYARATPVSREGLQPGADQRLTILVGEACRLAVLICRDGVGADVPAALANWGVNIVLVAAMSPSAAPFEALAESVGVYCRGVTVVANNPRTNHDVPQTCAVFGRPSEYLPRVRSTAAADAPAVTYCHLGDNS